MDELERHITKNRAEMDIHDPDPSLWGRIERNLPMREHDKRQFLWRAAVILLLAGMTAITVMVTRGGLTADRSVKTIVRETDQYYNSLIRSLYSEAEPMLASNPDVSNELMAGMQQLDSIAVSIREDLKENVATEDVLQALIQNYRLRIELLEDMLSVMQEGVPENEKKSDYEL